MIDSYPSIQYPAESDIDWSDSSDIVVLEKLDGANGRFTIEENELVFGSRNKVFKDEPVESQFKHAVEYLKQTVDYETFESLAGSHSVTVFGECLHKHRIDYDEWEGHHPRIDSDTPNFVVFAVYIDGEPTSWKTVQEWTSQLNLETPQVISSGDVQVSKLEIPQSMYRTKNPDAELEFNKKGKAEGMVLRHPDGERAKVVSTEFKEVNKSNTNVDNKTQQFVETYITKPRVLKKAKELQNGDNKYSNDALEMEMMQDLHSIVFEDALEESPEHNSSEISDDKRQKFHSQSSNKISTILQKEIQSF